MQDTFQTKPLTFNYALKIDLFRVYGFYSDKKTLGNYIRKARIGKKLTSEELAKQIGCHSNVLCLWETDKRIPKMNFLNKLNEIMPIPKPILKNILTKRFPLNEYESNNLFEFEMIRDKLKKCGKRDIGSLIKVYRLSYLMSLQDLGRIIGVEPATIHEWEKGRNRPDRRMVERILS